MTAATVYTSADSGAPTLNGLNGSLINVLDACLVNGYGSKDPAGWTKPFSAPNLAVYRMGTGGSSRRMYLRVTDNVGTRGAVRGYDDMTDVNTGTEPFPTATQFGGDGLVVWKSNAGDGSSRGWIVVASPRCFFMVALPSVTGASPASDGTNQWGNIFFGEYVNYVSGFEHNVMLVAGTNLTTSSQGGGIGAYNSPTGLNGHLSHYCCRPYTNTVGSVSVSQQCNAPWFSDGTSPYRLGVAGDALSTGNNGPDLVLGRAFGSRLQIMHSTGTTWVRAGRWPGVIVPHHPNGIGVPLDTVNGIGALAGKTFLKLSVPCAGQSQTNRVGQILLDLTDLDS